MLLELHTKLEGLSKEPERVNNNETAVRRD